MNTYAYTLVTGPTESPVTDSEMEAHARAAGQPSEQYLPFLLAAAEHVETITGRKLLSQTWKMFCDDWPMSDRLEIPFGRLTSVTHVKYTNIIGTVTTFDPSNWEISTARDPGVLALSYNKTWPDDTLQVLDPIEIQFVCGWASAGEVPAPIRNAILLIAAHLYEHREDVTLGNSASVESRALEMGSRALLVNWRLYTV